WSGAPSLQAATLSRAKIGANIPILQVPYPAAELTMNDTFAVRAGVEGRIDVTPKLGLTLRGGIAWEPSPLPPQHGSTNFVDNDRAVLGVGIGFVLGPYPPVLARPLS